MSKETVLLKFLEDTSARVRTHHGALWEEEKHYSWWVYVLFVGVVSLYAFANLEDPVAKLTLIIIASTFGLCLSIAALRIIRREGEQFHEALEMRNRALLALGLNKPVTRPDGKGDIVVMPEPEIHTDFKVETLQANKEFSNLLKALPKRELTIRDIFQLSFVATAILFASFIAFSYITIN